MTRRVVGALLVALFVSTVSGCSNGDIARTVRSTTTTTQPVPRVLVLGDSNLFESAAVVETALRDSGYEPSTRGVPGYGLKDLFFWLEELPGLLDADPNVVVVGLGTNDTERAADVERFPARLDRMMETIGDRPVIWITHVDARPGAPASAGRAINAAIRAAPERWPNLTLLDFGAEIANDPAILRADHLHFSRQGMQQWATAIATAVTARIGDSLEEPARS